MDLVPWDQWSDAIATGVKSVPDELLQQAAHVLSEARLVLTAGNGGSHALASHAAQALMKPGHAAWGGRASICLSDAVPTLTAHANDGRWESALVECARPFLDHHDCALLLFSSSGKSENIVRLALAGQAVGCSVVTMTGFQGEPLRSLATVSLHVDSNDYEVVEPVHCSLLHRCQAHLRHLTGAP